MAPLQKRERRYAICIKSDDPDLLTPRKIYEVLPDASAEKSNYIRVIDDEGEDYLYPVSCFAFVTLPDEVEKLLHVSQRGIAATKTYSPQRRRGILFRSFGGFLKPEHNTLDAVPKQGHMKIDQ